MENQDMDVEANDSPVKAFYRGKNIFVTGATGFLGIALIEKLLRCCKVGTIYVLVRPKRGKEIECRLEELKKNLVFERLREEQGDGPLSKVVPVAGDVGEENLGLSEKDRQTLVENVSVVFHSAATLDFEAGFKPTVNINLLGTRRVLELASCITNMEVFVHVSSAYISCVRSRAEEILYGAPSDTERLIHFSKTMSEDVLQSMASKLLVGHANTYTLTKEHAECEVAKMAGKFATAIVRPSMIVAAWKEPVPGWTISKNGPQGFIMGAGKGIVRRLPANKELVYDYIPVDIVVNALVTAGWSARNARRAQPEVFHCTSSTCKPFTWLQVEPRINAKLRAYPIKSAIWYPTMKLLPSLNLFRVSAIFVHFIPAFFLDLLLRITGGRPILMKLHTNVSRSLGRLAPFIFQEWFFDNTKMMKLHESLDGADKETFNLDITTLEWDEFFTNLVSGVRRYLHNEEPKTLAAARRKQNVLFVMNILVQASVLVLLWYLVSAIKGSTMVSVFWAVPLMYALFSFL